MGKRWLIALIALAFTVSGATAQNNCGLMGLPHTETFEGYGSGNTVLPDCWYVTRNYDLGLPPHIDTAERHSGTASLYFYSGTISESHYSMVITPPLDIDDLDGTFLRLWMKAASTSVRLEVGLCEDTNRYTRAFVPIDTINVAQGGHWQEIVVDLSSYTGTGRRIGLRLQRTLQSTPAECYIDDLNVSNCGTTLPWVNHIGSTTITVNYDTYGTGAITVSCGNDTIADATSPVTFNGLTPETEYTVTVACEGGMEQSITATTLEGAGMQTTYYVPFDSLPAKWRYPLSNTPTVANGVMTISSNSGDSSLAVLPFQEAFATNELTLALRLRAEGLVQLIVGVMDFPNELESFVPVDTLSMTGEWQTLTSPLANYDGTGHYIALMVVGSGMVKIDHLRVANCLLDNVRRYNLTNTSVTFAWDTLTANATTRIIYFPTDNPDDTTYIIPDSNPFPLTGLEPSTEYCIYVASACLDSLCDYDRHYFTTFSHELTIPYCTGFEEDGNLPHGWLSANNKAIITTNSYYGIYGLQLQAGGIATLPFIIYDDSFPPVLDFYASGNSTLEVGMQDTPYGEFQPLDTISVGLAWEHITLPLSNFSSHCLALRSSNNMTLDALAIRQNYISNAWVSDIDSASATIHWQSGYDDSIVVEYSAVEAEGTDFEAGSGIVIDTVGNSLLLEDLIPGSYYSVHISPLEGYPTCNYSTLHFRTLSGSIFLPYCSTFNDLGNNGYPEEWRRISTMGEYPIASTERNHSSPYSLRFSATSTKKTAAILPNIVTCSEHAVISFWTNATRNITGAKLLIGSLENVDDLSTFTATDTITFTSLNNWQSQTVDIDTLRRNVALVLVGGNSNETRLFIDDLCIQPCVARDVYLSNIDTTQITVRWTGIGATGLICQVKQGSVVEITDTLYTSPGVVSGFTAGLPYTISFRALCGCGNAGGTRLYGYGTTGIASTDSIRYTSINTVSPPLPLPYCDGFEGILPGQFPSSWSHIGGSSVTDQVYHSGSRGLLLNGGSTILMPSMSNIASLTASLYAYAIDEYALSTNALVIGTMRHRDSISSFLPTDTLHIGSMGAWNRLVGDLAADTSNSHYIALRYNAPTSSRLYLDDVSVSKCAIASASVSPEGTLVWQGMHDPQGVIIEYGAVGFSSDTIVPDTAYTSPYTISNFQTGITSEVRLRPLCSSYTSCAKMSIIVGGSTAIPYCENFDATSGNAMPLDWIVTRSYNQTPSISSSNGGKALKFNANATNRSIVSLPLPSNAPLSTLQLNFSMRTPNNNRARLLIGEMENPSDPNSFIATDTIVNNANNVWERFRVPLVNTSHDGWRPAIGCMSLNLDAELWIDSISITRAVTPQVSIISARNILLQSDSIPYFIEYGEEGFEQGSGVSLQIDTTDYIISNLLPEHTYQIHSLEAIGEATCLTPITVTLPNETALPYCHGDAQFSRLQLPELAIDNVDQLHLYFTLRGGTAVEVGVMNAVNGWNNFVPIDTVEAPAGTWLETHLSLQSYTGHGRFVALRSVSGAIATINALTVTGCELPLVEMNSDNTVSLTGQGSVEYGPTGFTQSEGTWVDITSQPTIVDQLATNTTYDFYPICNDWTPCYLPKVVTTTLSTNLPYCTSLGGQLPDGWSVTTNAANSTPVQCQSNCMYISIAEGQTVNINTLHIVETPVVMDFEMLASSSAIALIIGDDTIRNSTPNTWQTHRLSTSHNGRIEMLVVGSGSIKLRNMVFDLCATPREFTVVQPGDEMVELSWDTTGIGSDVTLIYSLGTQDEGTAIPIGVPPLSLQLEPDTSYNIFLRCSENQTCRAPISITTLPAPVTVPYCHIAAGTNNALPDSWLSTDNYIVLPQFYDVEIHDLNITFYAKSSNGTGLNVTLGTMLDANDPTTFDSIATFYSSDSRPARCFHSFANYYGNGSFIALRKNNGTTLRIDSLSVSLCAAYNIAMTETEADHVTFEWEQQGEPILTVEYGEPGFATGSGTLVTATATPLTIENLSALVNYAFYVTHSCGDANCLTPLVDTFFIFTPQGGSGCIDYTDLRASYVTCHYGSYTNPNENIGAIDHGYTSSLSRHTVHFDTAERDLRTGSLLRTVPVGAQASVRLGNWTAGGNGAPEAESITYALNIDSAEFDLLLLKYAAILQDPEHSASLQPRFRLQILNPQGELIDSCGMADFIANHNLGWHEAPGDVLWKDWTNVGIDLTPYNGQTILVRLTTNDCGEGSHFGYAYFTLECARRGMRTEGCSNVPSYRFTAPAGFNYRWYTNYDTVTTISDSASIVVPSDNSVTYFCNLSFIDNPSCNFTMSAFSGARFALALMDTLVTVEDCILTLHLTNRSTISPDGVNPDGTGDPVDSIAWFLPDTTLYSEQLSLIVPDTGYYPVTLMAGIANNKCTDTLTRNIHVTWPHQRPYIDARPRRCTAEPPDTITVFNTTSYSWIDSTVGIIVIAPPHDTTFTVYTADSNGCHDTLTHTLLVYTSYHFDAIDSVCSYDTAYLWRDSTLVLTPHGPTAPAPGQSLYTPYQPLHFTDTITSVDLCDSSYALTLQPMPHHFIEHYDTICHDHTFPFFDALLDSTGSYLHSGTTAFGCDSLVTQHLKVIPRVYTDDVREACDSMRWINGTLYTANVDDVRHTLYTTYGCDSIIKLYLTIHPSYYHLDSDTACAGTSYTWRNHVLTNSYPDTMETSWVADTLQTIYTCDSVLALSLTRIPLPHISIGVDRNCDSGGYILHAISDVPHLVWSSWPLDSLITGHEYDSVLSIDPNRNNTSYTLFADYSSTPVCPTTTKISLNPYQPPKAKLRVTPYTITNDNPDLEANDLSNEYGHRLWYLNNELLDDTLRHISMTAPMDLDSIVVKLVVNDGYCSDSATQSVIVERSALAIPNAFTPTQETNSVFKVEGINIHSYEINIYNRRGVLVYHSTDINESWDGYGRNGVLCPPAGYVYVIEYTTTFRPTAKHRELGTILLIR